FDGVDNFVRAHAPSFNRFHYDTDWNGLCSWLSTNVNPLIAEAYRIRHIEYLFSTLDIAPMLIADSLSSLLAAGKMGAESVVETEKDHQQFQGKTGEYRKYRQILLWALEAYLDYMHYQDTKTDRMPEPLIGFSRKVCPGDVVITFNYDSTL